MKIPEHFILPQKLKIEVEDIHVSKEEIFRAVGNSDPKMDRYVNDLIEELFATSLNLTSPEACYSVFKNPVIDISKGTLDIESVRFNTGKIVASSLRRSSFVAFFICTAGAGIEGFVKKMMAGGNSLEAFIADIIASILAEKIAEYVHYQVEKSASEFTLATSNRYSPGYCSWPVSDQQLLFRIMKNYTAGVTLTTSSLMLPIKSVSGIIGLGIDVKRTPYKCQMCKDENCILRKIS